ncbi:hypothetical protein BU16DRAFT_238310 [Lophium mytilinum]|uniref:Uncharacterized protein n=1 Tax=Lophium mytilinum TaxID=390894 RepID=A0A6A6R8V8_9PEZI|nr:hypothetical protein BU16DRAFT_238310 [Lophium mytilinum]
MDSSTAGAQWTYIRKEAWPPRRIHLKSGTCAAASPTAIVRSRRVPNWHRQGPPSASPAVPGSFGGKPCTALAVELSRGLRGIVRGFVSALGGAERSSTCQLSRYQMEKELGDQLSPVRGRKRRRQGAMAATTRTSASRLTDGCATEWRPNHQRVPEMLQRQAAWVLSS